MHPARYHRCPQLGSAKVLLRRRADMLHRQEEGPEDRGSGHLARGRASARRDSQPQAGRYTRWTGVREMRGAHAYRVALLPPSITRRQEQRLDLVGLSHLADAGGLNEVWQLEGGLLNAALALQVLPLLTPVAGHRHAVAVRLQAAWIGAQYGKSTSGVEGPRSKEQVQCCSRAAEEMSKLSCCRRGGCLQHPQEPQRQFGWQ